MVRANALIIKQVPGSWPSDAAGPVPNTAQDAGNCHKLQSKRMRFEAAGIDSSVSLFGGITPNGRRMTAALAYPWINESQMIEYGQPPGSIFSKVLYHRSLKMRLIRTQAE